MHRPLYPERSFKTMFNTSTRHKLSFVLMLVLGLTCIPIGTSFIAIGLSSALKYVILFGTFFVLIALFVLVTRILKKNDHSGIVTTLHEGKPATEIRYSLAQFTILSALIVCMATLGALAAWDYANAGSGIPASQLAATLCCSLSAFCYSYFAFMLLGRVRRGKIVLTKSGIQQYGRAFSSFLPWNSIAGMTTTHDDTPEIIITAYRNSYWRNVQLNSIWKLDTLPVTPMIEIDTFVLSIEKNVAYRLIEFYVENPQDRDEIGTESSLQRARIMP